MARFCTQCGSPAAEDLSFCSQCGTPLAAPSSAAPSAPAAGPAKSSAPSPGPAPAPKGSSTLIKVILGVVAFFVFLGVAGIGACVYMTYRVKKRAQELSQQYHLENLPGAGQAPYQGKKDPCALITQQEVSETLGTSVEPGVGTGDSRCQFDASGGGTSLNYEVTWEGGTMAMKMMMLTMKGAAAGVEAFQPVKGIGDEAYNGPMGSMFLMRKGDVLVMIDMRLAKLNTEAAQKIATLIAGRL